MTISRPIVEISLKESIIIVNIDVREEIVHQLVLLPQCFQKMSAADLLYEGNGLLQSIWKIFVTYHLEICAEDRVDDLDIYRFQIQGGPFSDDAAISS